MQINVYGLSPRQTRRALRALNRELVRLIHAEAALVAEPHPDTVFALHLAAEEAEEALLDLVDLSRKRP